jgi:hypothetical protein
MGVWRLAARRSKARLTLCDHRSSVGWRIALEEIND